MNNQQLKLNNNNANNTKWLNEDNKSDNDDDSNEMISSILSLTTSVTTTITITSDEDEKTSSSSSDEDLSSKLSTNKQSSNYLFFYLLKKLAMPSSIRMKQLQDDFKEKKRFKPVIDDSRPVSSSTSSQVKISRSAPSRTIIEVINTSSRKRTHSPSPSLNTNKLRSLRENFITVINKSLIEETRGWLNRHDYLVEKLSEHVKKNGLIQAVNTEAIRIRKRKNITLPFKRSPSVYYLYDKRKSDIRRYYDNNLEFKYFTTEDIIDYYMPKQGDLLRRKIRTSLRLLCRTDTFRKSLKTNLESSVERVTKPARYYYSPVDLTSRDTTPRAPQQRTSYISAAKAKLEERKKLQSSVNQVAKAAEGLARQRISRSLSLHEVYETRRNDIRAKLNAKRGKINENQQQKSFSTIDFDVDCVYMPWMIDNYTRKLAIEALKKRGQLNADTSLLTSSFYTSNKAERLKEKQKRKTEAKKNSSYVSQYYLNENSSIKRNDLWLIDKYFKKKSESSSDISITDSDTSSDDNPRPIVPNKIQKPDNSLRNKILKTINRSLLHSEVSGVDLKLIKLNDYVNRRLKRIEKKALERELEHDLIRSFSCSHLNDLRKEDMRYLNMRVNKISYTTEDIDNLHIPKALETYKLKMAINRERGYKQVYQLPARKSTTPKTILSPKSPNVLSPTIRNDKIIEEIIQTKLHEMDRLIASQINIPKRQVQQKPQQQKQQQQKQKSVSSSDDDESNTTDASNRSSDSDDLKMDSDDMEIFEKQPTRKRPTRSATKQTPKSKILTSLNRSLLHNPGELISDFYISNMNLAMKRSIECVQAIARQKSAQKRMVRSLSVDHLYDVRREHIRYTNGADYKVSFTTDDIDDIYMAWVVDNYKRKIAVELERRRRLSLFTRPLSPSFMETDSSRANDFSLSPTLIDKFDQILVRQARIATTPRAAEKLPVKSIQPVIQMDRRSTSEPVYDGSKRVTNPFLQRMYLPPESLNSSFSTIDGGNYISHKDLQLRQNQSSLSQRDSLNVRDRVTRASETSEPIIIDDYSVPVLITHPPGVTRKESKRKIIHLETASSSIEKSKLAKPTETSIQTLNAPSESEDTTLYSLPNKLTKEDPVEEHLTIVPVENNLKKSQTVIAQIRNKPQSIQEHVAEEIAQQIIPTSPRTREAYVSSEKQIHSPMSSIEITKNESAAPIKSSLVADNYLSLNQEPYFTQSYVKSEKVKTLNAPKTAVEEFIRPMEFNIIEPIEQASEIEIIEPPASFANFEPSKSELLRGVDLIKSETNDALETIDILEVERPKEDVAEVSIVETTKLSKKRKSSKQTDDDFGKTEISDQREKLRNEVSPVKKYSETQIIDDVQSTEEFNRYNFPEQSNNKASADERMDYESYEAHEATILDDYEPVNQIDSTTFRPISAAQEENLNESFVSEFKADSIKQYKLPSIIYDSEAKEKIKPISSYATIIQDQELQEDYYEIESLKRNKVKIDIVEKSPDYTTTSRETQNEEPSDQKVYTNSFVTKHGYLYSTKNNEPEIYQESSTIHTSDQNVPLYLPTYDIEKHKYEKVREFESIDASLEKIKETHEEADPLAFTFIHSSNKFLNAPKSESIHMTTSESLDEFSSIENYENIYEVREIDNYNGKYTSQQQVNYISALETSAHDEVSEADSLTQRETIKAANVETTIQQKDELNIITKDKQQSVFNVAQYESEDSIESFADQFLVQGEFNQAKATQETHDFNRVTSANPQNVYNYAAVESQSSIEDYYSQFLPVNHSQVPLVRPHTNELEAIISNPETSVFSLASHAESNLNYNYADQLTQYNQLPYKAEIIEQEDIVQLEPTILSAARILNFPHTTEVGNVSQVDEFVLNETQVDQAKMQDEYTVNLDASLLKMVLLNVNKHQEDKKEEFEEKQIDASSLSIAQLKPFKSELQTVEASIETHDYDKLYEIGSYFNKNKANIIYSHQADLVPQSTYTTALNVANISKEAITAETLDELVENVKYDKAQSDYEYSKAKEFYNSKTQPTEFASSKIEYDHVDEFKSNSFLVSTPRSEFIQSTQESHKLNSASVNQEKFYIAPIIKREIAVDETVKPLEQVTLDFNNVNVSDSLAFTPIKAETYDTTYLNRAEQIREETIIERCNDYVEEDLIKRQQASYELETGERESYRVQDQLQLAMGEIIRYKEVEDKVESIAEDMYSIEEAELNAGSEASFSNVARYSPQVADDTIDFNPQANSTQNIIESSINKAQINEASSNETIETLQTSDYHFEESVIERHEEIYRYPTIRQNEALNAYQINVERTQQQELANHAVFETSGQQSNAESTLIADECNLKVGIQAPIKSLNMAAAIALNESSIINEHEEELNNILIDTEDRAHLTTFITNSLEHGEELTFNKQTEILFARRLSDISDDNSQFNNNCQNKNSNYESIDSGLGVTLTPFCGNTATSADFTQESFNCLKTVEVISPNLHKAIEQEVSSDEEFEIVNDNKEINNDQIEPHTEEYRDHEQFHYANKIKQEQLNSSNLLSSFTDSLDGEITSFNDLITRQALISEPDNFEAVDSIENFVILNCEKILNIEDSLNSTLKSIESFKSELVSSETSVKHELYEAKEKTQILLQRPEENLDFINEEFVYDSLNEFQNVSKADFKTEANNLESTRMELPELMALAAEKINSFEENSLSLIDDKNYNEEKAKFFIEGPKLEEKSIVLKNIQTIAKSIESELSFDEDSLHSNSTSFTIDQVSNIVTEEQKQVNACEIVEHTISEMNTEDSFQTANMTMDNSILTRTQEVYLSEAEINKDQIFTQAEIERIDEEQEEIWKFLYENESNLNHQNAKLTTENSFYHAICSQTDDIKWEKSYEIINDDLSSLCLPYTINEIKEANQLLTSISQSDFLIQENPCNLEPIRHINAENAYAQTNYVESDEADLVR